MKSAQLLASIVLTGAVAAIETTSIALRGIHDRASNSTEVYSRQLELQVDDDDVYIEETTFEEELVIALIGDVPYVGSVVSFFVDLTWQNGKVSIWDVLKDRFESLVENKISEYHLGQVQASMKGLQEKIEDYYNEPVLGGVKDHKLEAVLSHCIDIKHEKLFMVSDASFDTNKDLAFRMIALDVTFSLIHLTMLRERYLFGPHIYPGYNQSAVRNDANWEEELRDEIHGYNAYYRRVKDEWIDWRRGYIKIRSQDYFVRGLRVCIFALCYNGEKIYQATEVDLTDGLNEFAPRNWRKKTSRLKKEVEYFRNRAWVPFDYITALLAPVDDLNGLFSLPPPEERCPFDHTYQNGQCIEVQRCAKDSDCSDQSKSCDFSGLLSSQVGFCAEKTTPDPRPVVRKEDTVRYNKRVALATTNTPGLTSNCGMYGCRVLQSSYREVKLGHGGRRDTTSRKPGSTRAFYVRGLFKDRAKNNGTCVKYGDEIYFARTSEAYKTGNCGIYGCRVMFANGKEGSFDSSIRLHHGQYAKPFKIEHFSRPSTYVGKCVKLGDPVYLMAKTPEDNWDFFYKSGDREVSHGTSKTKFYLFNGY